jgi:hypothetical protein
MRRTAYRQARIRGAYCERSTETGFVRDACAAGVVLASSAVPAINAHASETTPYHGDLTPKRRLARSLSETNAAPTLTSLGTRKDLV